MKFACLATILVASTAHAGTLGDALVRHRDADIATLRAQLPETAARCTLGAAYARRSDLPRAALYLDECDDAQLPDEVAADVRRAVRETRKQLEASQLSRIAVDSTPSGMTVELDALPGERFATPRVVWAKAGRYELRGAVDGRTYAMVVAIDAHSRTTAVLDTTALKKTVKTVTAPAEKKLDFVDDAGAETQQSGPPPDVKHPSLIKGKFAGEVAAIVNENELQDPMEVRARRLPYREPTYRLGVRVGGGMFDDSTGAARAGIDVAATTRIELAPGLFAAGRFDWSRRGGEDGSGDASGGIDVLGASVGAGKHLLAFGWGGGVAAIAQLRGDLRLASSRAMEPVHRAGLSVAGGIEIALPDSPITAGLRFEQGLTTLVDDARDRAVLLEVGVDLRLGTPRRP